MPKPQLTQEAISFIIQTRDDPTTITTWEDIAKMVQERFNIMVSLQGIAKSYHRNKGKIDIKTILPSVSISKQSEEPEVATKKPAFKPKKNQTSLSEPLFKKDEDIDLQDLFEPEE